MLWYIGALYLFRCMNKCFAIIFFYFFVACNSAENIPDVSGIKISAAVKRFDNDFFSVDTNHIVASLDTLQKKYPYFLNDFLYSILALPPNADSAAARVKLFIRDYASINDSVQKSFPDFDKQEAAIKHGLQLVKYYFPSYKLPEHIITFTGPLEGYANVLTTDGMGIGLQLYLGKDFSVYHTSYLSEVYPAYQNRRFEAAYIPVNCLKNIVSDLYPEQQMSLPLVFQMIEAGKRLYLLDKFLPATADSLKTGYTAAQLQGCFNHEEFIWSFFVKNGLLFSTDLSALRDYMNDGPKTEVLGESAPGFIGQFIGWQIIKKWMKENKDKTLQQLIETPPAQIYEQAKYKP